MADVRYDPNVIQELANKLYQQANTLVLLCVLVGVAMVGGGGAAAMRSPIGLVLGGLLGGAIGYAVGQQLSFGLRVKAQTALCQAQIEMNTRDIGRRDIGRAA